MLYFALVGAALVVFFCGSLGGAVASAVAALLIPISGVWREAPE